MPSESVGNIKNRLIGLRFFSTKVVVAQRSTAVALWDLSCGSDLVETIIYSVSWIEPRPEVCELCTRADLFRP